MLILGFRIEAGAGFRDVRQVAVAEDMSTGVLASELFQQAQQGDFLLRCAGVGGFAVRRQAALVADADAVLVVTLGVGTDELFVARLVGGAVLAHVPVVAGEAEAGIVAGDEVLQREAPVAARRAAVDNDKFYCSHRFLTENGLFFLCLTERVFLMSRRLQRHTLLAEKARFLSHTDITDDTDFFLYDIQLCRQTVPAIVVRMVAMS